MLSQYLAVLITDIPATEPVKYESGVITLGSYWANVDDIGQLF